MFHSIAILIYNATVFNTMPAIESIMPLIQAYQGLACAIL